MLEDQWLIRPYRALGAARFRLFCLPHAGGGASIYRHWGAALHPLAEVWAVQLPGREERIREPRFYSIDKLVDALLEAEENRGCFDEPYVLFGHSMGAKIAYELTRRLEQQGRPPRALLVSGSRPVNLPAGRQISRLPDGPFTEELRHLAGTPEAILRDEEFMAMYRPLLRADFAMDEGYRHDTVLRTPLAAFAGREDSEVDGGLLAAWRTLSSGPFLCRTMAGDHFYLQKDETAFLELMRQVLAALANPDGLKALEG